MKSVAGIHLVIRPIQVRRLFRLVRIFVTMMIVTGAGARTRGQTLNLELYLPYSAGDMSTFSSDAGFDLTLAGTSETEFNWLVSGPEEGLRQKFRLDALGLALLSEEGVAQNGVVLSTETHTPAWIVSPVALLLGQTVNSSTAFSGSEPGVTWSGTANGTFSVGAIEAIVTPAGTFTATKLAFISVWTEIGTGYTAQGTTTEIWWVVPDVGVVKLDYAYQESYTEDGETETDTGQVVFVLKSSSRLTPAFHVPDPNLKAELVRILRPAGELTAADMARLTIAFGANNKGITNLTGLEAAINLPNLVLQQNQISDLTPLQGLTNLAILNLSFNAIQDLSPLANLTKLQQVTIQNNSIADASPLAGLTNLTFLALNNNRIRDLNPFAQLSRLTVLALSGNQIPSTSGLSALAGLTNLQGLSLAGQRLRDISGLSGLRRLTQLDIAGNQLSDVSPLLGLTNLAILNIGTNRFMDASPLRSLTKLRTLNAEDNLITDITSLGELTALRTVTIQRNSLDIPPGADDRSIIDAWIAQGATVTFEPQNGSLPRLTAQRQGQSVRLQWDSKVGTTYRLHTSTNLVEWAEVPTPTFLGTGQLLLHDLPILSQHSQYFRLVIVSE